VPHDLDDSELTRDTISEGALELLQREEGYRFGLDAVLLATDLPDFDPSGRIVELGAGQGLVALAVATRFPEATVRAVERQASLADLLESNVAHNKLRDRVEPLRGDIREYRELFEPHTADLVLCNPPYYPEGDHRMSDDPERAAARHELAGDLSDFVRAAQYVATQRGRFKTIVPPIRLDDLVEAVADTDFSLEWMRFFHSREASDAYLLEVVMRRGGAADVSIRPPLIVYDGPDYTDEVRSRIDSAARVTD
jgi:tRNA1Val (adenine37-N6)-methyltransferase